MNYSEKSESPSTRLRYYAILLVCLWTVVVIASLFWNIHQRRQATRELAVNEARGHFDKEQAFRFWGISHGGVYVPSDKRTPPNPHLSHLKERDIITPSGRKLTLMNASYMVRQLQEDFFDMYKIPSRITSLKPLRSQNAPDAWERSALKAFETGANEVFEFTAIKGEPYVRLMRSMRTEKGCLKCHEILGYKEGDILGGFGVSVPMSSYLEREYHEITQLSLTHVLLWLLGLGGIAFGYRGLSGSIAKRRRAEQDLKESEILLKAMFDSITDPLHLIDKDFRVLMTNKSLLDYKGLTQEETLGKHCYEVYQDRNNLCDECAAQGVFSSGKPVKIQKTLPSKDGSSQYFEVSAFPIKNDDGKVSRVIETTRNVTERMQAEEALRKSEKSYRYLVENANDMIYKIDLTGHFTFINPIAIKITGYSQKDLIGKYYMELIRPDYHEDAERFYTLQYEKKIPSTYYEFPIITKDGKEVWLGQHAQLLIEDDLIIGFHSVARDITERIQVEKALQESEKKFRVAFQSTPDSVTITRVKDGRYVYVNDGFCRVTGYSREEAIGKTPFDLNLIIDPDDRENFIIVLKEKGEIDGFELQYRMKDGTTIDTLLSAKPLRYAEEDCIVAVVKDITAIKRAEQEKAGLEIRLQQAQKMEAIGTLAGGVAHDLNNILSGLVSYPDLLLMDIPEESPLRKPIQTIRKSGEKAAAIVQDLLTLARRGVVVSEVVNLNSIVTEYLASPEFEKLRYYHPQVQVETGLETDLMNISGSPVHLSKTLMNLVSNAAEAVPDGGGGRILLSTKNRYIDSPIRGYDDVAEGDYVVFSISDTGIGISPEDMERIFEPFYTKKEMGRSGTGLGMAVVWGTVKDHRGYIDINSTEGKGSKFTLYFPVTRDESKKDKSLISIEDYMGKGESILIVDDVEERREIATGILKKLGYSVISVSSGEEAVEYLKENTVDLIVLDMIMAPGIDGLETYKRIIGFHSKQKTIIASGFSETARVKEAQRLGAGAYIKKPYVLAKIGMAVRAELDR